MIRVHRTDRIARLRVRADGTIDGTVRRAGVLRYDHGAEYVPPSELGSPVSLRGRAVTVGHPPGGIAGRLDGVGAIVDARVDGAELVATMRIDAPSVRAAIEAGTLRELSAGYSCQIEKIAGTAPTGERYDAVQRAPRFDHVALLPPGGARCGATCSLRADERGGSCPCSMKGKMTMDEETRKRMDALEENVTRLASRVADVLDGKATPPAHAADDDTASKRLDALEKMITDLGKRLDAKPSALDAARAAVIPLPAGARPADLSAYRVRPGDL